MPKFLNLDQPISTVVRISRQAHHIPRYASFIPCTLFRRNTHDDIRSITNSSPTTGACLLSPQTCHLLHSRTYSSTSYYRPLIETLPHSPILPKQIRQLQRQLRNPTATPQKLYSLYNALPQPRAQHLPPTAMHHLLHRLIVLLPKSELSMLNLMSVIHDMNLQRIPLTTSEWTSAIAFAGRWLKHISSQNVDTALDLWRKMESQPDMSANEVTFNVLFDIAVKARKFVLADMLLREMKARNLNLTRYSHVTLIYYHGLKADSVAVRQAYHELVAAGEIVDSVVIACVIQSLLRCGEPAAAENVFTRIKRHHIKTRPYHFPQPSTRKEHRNLGKILQETIANPRQTTTSIRDLQAKTPCGPTIEMYRALIYYYAVKIGDMERVTSLFTEMRQYNLHIHGELFIHLFRGFINHGGLLYGAWTASRLDSVFVAFLNAIDAQSEEKPAPHVYLSKSAVTICICAYFRCTNHAQTKEIWITELLQRWKPSHDEKHDIETLITDLQARKRNADGETQTRM